MRVKTDSFAFLAALLLLPTESFAQVLPEDSSGTSITRAATICSKAAADVESYMLLAKGALNAKSEVHGGHVSSQLQMAALTALTRLELLSERIFQLPRGPGREQKCDELRSVFKGRVDAVMQSVFKGVTYKDQFFPIPYLTDPSLARGQGFGFGIRLSRMESGLPLSNGTKGVAVSEVVRGSPADGLIRVGDVVLAIDHWATDTERDAAAAVATLRQGGRTSANILIRRRDGTYAQVLVGYPG